MGILSQINGFLGGAKEARNQIGAITGQQAHYVATLSGSDVQIPAAWRNCRFVECDVDGIVRVTYTGDNSAARTETKALAKGERWLIPDVQTVHYQYGTSPASCDTQVYNDVGDLVAGIKLKY